jgi:hypothetical protein
LVQTSFLPEDDVAVEPSAEQYSPARTDRLPGAGLAGYQRGRESPGRFMQRAQDPVEVLPTAPIAVQNLPTFTTPGTVTEARGIALRAADADAGVLRPADLAEALAATVDAFFFPPHPVSATAALRATLIRASGRFMWPPIQVPDQGLK